MLYLYNPVHAKATVSRKVKQLNICDVNKQNESQLANTDFEI